MTGYVNDMVSAEHMIWYTSRSANINSLLSSNKDIPTIMQQRTPNIFHTLTTRWSLNTSNQTYKHT